MPLVFLRSNDDVVLDVFIQNVMLEVPTFLHRPCGEESEVTQFNKFTNSV